MDVKKKKSRSSSVADFSLLIGSDTDESLGEFDRKKISDSLMSELDLSEHDSKDIADVVEEKLSKLDVKRISTGLIREFVNVTLAEMGFTEELRESQNYKIPKHNLESLIENQDVNNSNVSFNPESINLTISENILKQYALSSIFTKEVVKAHLNNDIYIHDLGYLRLYCHGANVEYLKLNGLNLPSSPIKSLPAKEPEVLVMHILTFATFLSSLFAGAIGFDAVNVFIAPLLEGCSDKRIYQVAQMLMFGFGQLSFSRGSQVIFNDLNFYYEVPEHFKKSPAIGPKGESTGKTYGDYNDLAQKFFAAVLDVAYKGDKNGLPFPFPKIDSHIDANTFKPENKWLFDKACKVAGRNGGVYFLFDRGDELKVSQCCRLNISFTKEESKQIREHPEIGRFAAAQNITINLPKLSLTTSSEKEFFKKLEHMVRLATWAHLEKLGYIKKLMKLGENSPLHFFDVGMNGEPYIKLENVRCLIGMVGLNECVKNMTGEELHDSDKAFKLGLKIISSMKLLADKFGKKHNLMLLLEESPAESAAHRLAVLDVKNFGKDIAVQGSEERGYYYTNSVHFAYDADMDWIDRVINQSKFHPLIKAGCMLHIWLGEVEPSPESIGKFLEKTYNITETTQLVFSPEFTICGECSHTFKGLHDKCERCNSTKVDHMTRIVGYFSKVSNWVQGKKSELKDRVRRGI